MASERRRGRSLRYEQRILGLAVVTGLPAVAVALLLLWSGDFAPRTQWTVTIVLLVVWLAFVGVLWERVVRPLQTVSNMLRHSGKETSRCGPVAPIPRTRSACCCSS